MPTNLRRLLNHLPLFQGGRGAIYIRSSWHKPSPFDQWTSQPPFRPMTHPPLRTEYFGRSPRRLRLMRGLVYGVVAIATVWLVVESVRGLALL